jgi:hypothetical protein
VWLQIIDSRDLGWKISGMKILLEMEKPEQISPSNPSQQGCPQFGDERKKSNDKSKRRRGAQPFLISMY